MRAFVIGNGSSLNTMDLGLMAGEYTVGCNRLDLLELGWNPTVWVLADVVHEDGWWDWEDLFYRKARGPHDNGTPSQFHLKYHDEGYLDQKYRDLPNVQFQPPCVHNGSPRHPVDSWHLPTLCQYGGSIGWALQLAVLAGADPVYLIGCDLYKYRAEHESDINHFHPDYCGYTFSEKLQRERNAPEDWERLNDRLVRAHEIARDTSGVEIFNAGVGGALDAYPRVDYTELFK